jgi:hypothetical protein
MASFFGAANSVSKFAPDRFRATLTNNFGLASPNRFQVEFPKLDGLLKPNGGAIFDKTTSEDRDILCVAAGMPSKNITTVNRGYGMENQMVASGHTFPEVSFSFYLTNTYSMREYFERWMQAVTSADPEEAQYLGYYGGKDGYASKDVKVRAYTRNGRKAYTVDLINCYPTQCGEIQFQSSNQTAAHEMTVSISYRTYKTKQEKTAPIG